MLGNTESKQLYIPYKQLLIGTTDNSELLYRGLRDTCYHEI